MKVVNNIKSLLYRRKELRNSSTSEEILLWQKLKNSQIGFKFRRQHSIGGYIVDFYCPAKKLVIEIDGSSHFTKDGKEDDVVRTKFLEGMEIKVIRFSNMEVTTETQNVVEKIKSALTTP